MMVDPIDELDYESLAEELPNDDDEEYEEISQKRKRKSLNTN